MPVVARYHSIFAIQLNTITHIASFISSCQKATTANLVRIGNSGAKKEYTVCRK